MMMQSLWKTLWQGFLTPEKLHVIYDRDMPIYPATYAEEVWNDWQAELARMTEGVVLFDGPLATLKGFHAYRGADGMASRLDLHLGRTSYRFWMHDSGRHREIDKRFGAPIACRPLAVSAGVITADEKWVLEKRSPYVIESPGCLHVPAGHIDPKRDQCNGSPDPTLAIYGELKEELNLEASDFSSCHVVGVIEAHRNGKPELLYIFQTPLSAGDVHARASGGNDRFEYDDLLFPPVAETPFTSWLDHIYIPMAVPALALSEMIPSFYRMIATSGRG
jgi:8-oxo-dGTP pyrophosphatase MutT (NUDIX family)